jgi:GcrA cell cycle regulator
VSEVDEPVTWTPERVAELERLWREGHSASEVAKALGGITRNAVIGKANRLGLPKRSTRFSQSYPKSRKSPAGSAYRSVPVRRGSPEPESERVSILDIRNFGRCKFGTHIEDGEHLFCGHLVRDGSPYCDHHHARCYMPAKKPARAA